MQLLCELSGFRLSGFHIVHAHAIGFTCNLPHGLRERLGRLPGLGNICQMTVRIREIIGRLAHHVVDHRVVVETLRAGIRYLPNFLR